MSDDPIAAPHEGAGMGKPASHGGVERRVALISMPWHNPFIPSIQLGALKAYVERELAGTTVDTFHYYLELEEIVGLDVGRMISEISLLGEASFSYMLFPGKADDILDFINEEKAKYPELSEVDFRERVIEPIAAAIRRRADQVDWSRYDCIGFSLVFGQTMASALMARLIKERVPDAVVIIGGPSCAGRIGISLLQTFDQFNFVVNGEGEIPLVQFLRQLRGDRSRLIEIPGIVAPNGSAAVNVNQLRDLQSLPAPDFGPYFDLLDTLVTGPIVRAKAVVPIEGSRGCWWDKSAHDPMRSCSFCNLNLQWNGYREKSVDQFVSELSALGDAYGVRDFLLVDNILRHSEVEELCAKIIDLRRDFRIGIEARVSLKPREIELLAKAGVVYIQFGIEALSSDILKTIYKGTSCIQNIQAMKFCEQFGIENISNIIVYHPGVAAESLRDTLRNIEFVTCYRPLSCSRFTLSYQSPIFKNPSRFGVSNIRDPDKLLSCFPSEVRAGLFWPDKSFEVEASEEVRHLWQQVEAAVEAWKQAYFGTAARFGVRSLLTYEDRIADLLVTDYRATPPRTFRVDEVSRALYLGCEVACTAEKLRAVRPELSIEEVSGRLDTLVSERLVFREGAKYLSLAVRAEPARPVVLCERGTLEAPVA